VPAPPSTASTATLVADHLSIDRNGRRVLTDVSVTVGPDSCIGVVGPNGVGKSTLLGVLAGRLVPDGGRVRLSPPTASVGLLDQEHRPVADETVRAMLTRRLGISEAEAELQAAAAGLATGDRRAGDRYVVALERLSALSGGDFDARVESILTELGAPEVLDRPTAALSGGQAAKVALAAIGLARFDLTLLDEPTNDLDFAGLAHLEAFVGQRPGGMVVVSHDRDFLDRTITSVLELDEHDRTGRLFGGGWSAYLEERVVARQHAEEAHDLYRSRRADLAARARRERQWATTGVSREKRQAPDNDKAQRDFRVNRTEKLAGRARRTERALEALEPVDKPWQGWDLRYTIDQAPRAGAVVVRLTGAVVERGDFSLGPIDLEIAWADRVALTGANGTGKSSLVAAIVGQLALAAGQRWVGPSVVVGQLGQARSGGPWSVAERLVGQTGMTTSEARSLLAKFGLGADQVGRPAATLSPGERTRAELAAFQATGVNFLVLDEPTNHLDLPAIEQLESALAGFGGTVLLVSHDRRLLDTVELTRTIELGRPSGH